MLKSSSSFLIALIVLLTALVQSANAQHLWWNADGQKDATCAYGQITVLVTHENTYYCGLNWHPGEAAGGYCGIQHNSGDEKRTIFSIWDTTPQLHPKVTQADEKTEHGRFGGEGEGGHTHMIWPWKIGETFEFYVTKTPGDKDTSKDSTNVKYYVYDREHKKWIHSATINCPNGGHDEVQNLSGGGMDAFLENFSGQDKDAPRLATYRLWIGTDVDSLKPLTHAGGDGKWGTLHDAYFLAGGSMENLNTEFAKLEKDYGKPVFGSKEAKPDAIPAKPIDEKVLKALKDLPTAADAK